MKRKCDQIKVENKNQQGKQTKKEQKKQNQNIKIPKQPIPKKGKRNLDEEIEKEKKQNLAGSKELAKIEEKIYVLDTDIENSKKRLSEVKKEVEKIRELKSSDNVDYEEKLVRTKGIYNLELERANMLEEDKISLIQEINNFKERITQSELYVKNTKSIEINSKSDLEKMELKLKEKREEIIELKKIENEVRKKLEDLMEKEINSKEEDELVEYTIHRMKGHLYTILMVDNKIRTEFQNKIAMNSLEVKIPQKIDAWIQMKFDSIIWEHFDLCEKFEPIQCLYDLSKNMLHRFFIRNAMSSMPAVNSLENTEKSSLEEDSKSSDENKFNIEQNEITYIILACHNQISKIAEYIQFILSKIPILTNSSIVYKIMGTVYCLSETSSIFPLKMGEITSNGLDSQEFIEEVIERQAKNGNNFSLELSICSDNIDNIKPIILKFIILNTQDPKNLEDVQRRSREILQSRLNSKKYSAKGNDILLQEALANVKIGYLILLWNHNIPVTEFDKEIEHQYNILQAARTISECIPALRLGPDQNN